MAEKVTFETRTVAADFEMRDDATTGAPTLEGYAATFNQEYDLGPFRERIDPGAFNRTLGTGPDVRLLVDHEGQPLARTKSGTLTLTPDSQGLQVRATLDPADPDVQRLLPKMRRGDLDQMSFAFRVPAGGDTWDDGYTLRTLRQVELNGGDVSVVTYPANPTTTVSVRAKDLHEARCVFVETMIRELRVGKAISAENMTKLQQVLASLADVDASLDAADSGLDDALQTMADVIGVPNPDPADPADDAPQQNSGRPTDLSRRIAVALSL